MNLDDRDIEEIDMKEEYEMIPLEPMMYGCGQMNMMPNMGVNPNMAMYQGLGMNQFNEGMFMNNFNPMAMMYGESFMNDYEGEDEGLRQYQGNEPFKGQYDNPNKFNQKYNDVDFIVRRIERYNPAVFRLFNRYGIPYGEAKGIVRRIVRLTLMYSEE